MWILIPGWFLSIVVKPDDTPDTLTVRARVREDLDRFRDVAAKLGHEPVDPTMRSGVGTDYQHRQLWPRAAVAAVLAHEAMTTEVGNFKDAVKGVLGWARARAYSRVWGVLFDLEDQVGHREASARRVAAPQTGASQPGLRLEPGMTGWIGRGTVRVTVLEVDSDDCAACTNTDGVIHFVHRTPGKGWLDGSDQPFVPDLLDRATRLLLGG